MNRYICEGIASDLEAGARIGLTLPPYLTVPNAFSQIMEYADEDYTQVRLSYEEIVHASGGILQIVRPFAGIRDTRFDVLVIHSSYPREDLVGLDPRTELIDY